MKVAIWGSYNHGNYGDDLMAIQFAKYFKDLGVHPCVYRLDERLAQKYSIESAKSLNDLLENASFGVIGGGGMLTGTSEKKSPQNQSSTDILENDFLELTRLCSEKKCKIFPISVGGDGRGIDTPLNHRREEFWKSDNCGDFTVRLQEDVPLVKKLGKNAVYHPDILLTVSDTWVLPSSPNSDDKLHVGINIGKSKANYFLAFYLSLIATMQKNIVFHFIRTHLPNSSQDYELLPKIRSPYIRHHTYTDPDLTLKFLASLDLLISSKLHLGLTALALKVPFYSFEGQAKTISFLKSINADFAFFSHNELFKLAKLITNVEQINKAKSKFNFVALEHLKVESKSHLDFLQELVNSYS
ncbi:polysaccharide pyruvyl transferase family protein [Pleurocapsa sp. PCC 7319]|uniref:polysaccharide pyruvyl transferase family protein n=1 Tax=Pleurocapsa sp. PCC 7319 TaxID=118161 RepID=UPI00034B0EEF|nr:polysaccharide pyruvyl transferase family protein [Pleurocapsa sp. PCC 7319]